VGAIFDLIRQAVREERYIISWHADERCEQRGIADWQLVAGLDDAALVHERPGTMPHPSIVVRQLLADGGEVEVIWGWMAQSQRAKLVTVYFLD
jgi:Domain of unknown function (DUF4258)